MQNRWKIPEKFPVLNHGQLHVWRGIYNEADQHTGSSLSLDEQARSQRFHFDHDRGMFLYSHSLLRRLLAGYLDREPREVVYGYTKFGKPYLDQSVGKEKIEFNLSHSGDMVLIGITKDIPIGVDVEEITPIPDLNQIAARYFSESEHSDLVTLSDSARIPAFYRCWTRKESLIKAIGEGLSMPLDSFRVSLLPDEPARLFESLDRRKWTLLDLNPTKGYTAAAAVPIPILQAVQFSADGI